MTFEVANRALSSADCEIGDMRRSSLEARVEELEAIMLDIAMMADGHKASLLYVGERNVALENIRNMAAFALGLEGRLRENGHLGAYTPTRV